jgi:transposase-like protein
MRKKRGRSRKATLAECKRQIAAQLASGLTQKAFCLREGISRTAFYRWLRQVNGAKRSVAGRGKRATSSGRVRPSFAEVRVQPEAAAPEAASPAPSSFGVTILLSSGDRLFLPEACDPRWLGQIVRALRSVRC